MSQLLYFISTVVAHFKDNNCKLLSYTLAVRQSTERHFAFNCAREFENAAKEWNIHEKVTTFSTDCAKNMIAAVNYLPYRRLSCSAHSLQLTINKAVAASNVDDPLSSCRKIVGHFKRSAQNALDLEKVKNNKKNYTCIINSTASAFELYC